MIVQFRRPSDDDAPRTIANIGGPRAKCQIKGCGGTGAWYASMMGRDVGSLCNAHREEWEGTAARRGAAA